MVGGRFMDGNKATRFLRLEDWEETMGGAADFGDAETNSIWRKSIILKANANNRKIHGWEF
jgi:hypothetical protein